MNDQNNSPAAAAATPGTPASPANTRAELPTVKAGSTGTVQTVNGTAQPAEPAESVKRFVINDTNAVITLETPIKLGNEQTIERVTVRMPRSGDLRGLALVEMGNLEVDTLTKLLPRITMPSLAAPMIDQLMPYDLLNLGRCVSSFFSSKKERAQLAQEMERDT